MIVFYHESWDLIKILWKTSTLEEQMEEIL